MTHIFLDITLILCAAMLVPAAARGEHPFLIVKKSEYAELQAKAAMAPWSDFVAQARRDVALDPTRSKHINKRAVAMARIVGAGALLYVLEPGERAAHKGRLVEMLDEWPAFLREMKEFYAGGKQVWFVVVPPSGAFLNSVLALDVIHDELTAADLARIERNMDEAAEWFWSVRNKWSPGPCGAAATWALYRGDTVRAADAAKRYRRRILDTLSPDGVGTMGTFYAQGRYGGTPGARKYGFMHVAEYTGADPHYYADPQFKSFYEWLYLAGFSPFNETVSFGDGDHRGGFDRFHAMPYAVGRFSPVAAQFAARRMAIGGKRGDGSPGSLLAYCIVKSAPPPAPEFFPSRVWPDGEAVFWEANGTADALMGALWNSTTGQEHRHPDANAVYLAGYGEHLLLNSGYNGWQRDACGFPWSYIHEEAKANNVALIGNRNHAGVHGDGIEEHMLTPCLDYACGRADNALGGNARHNRGFLFVKPADGKNGYFLLMDELDTGGQADTVNLVLHPASAAYAAVRANEEYRWTIRRRKETDTFLSVFLATQPQAVEISDGVLAAWHDSFVGKYLNASYATRANKRNLVTVLFPHDADHAKAAMARVAADTHTGARIEHGRGIADYALESDGRAQATQQRVRFQGRAAVYRVENGRLGFYFVRQGLAFSDGAAAPTGFAAEAPVSVCLQEGQGRIVSPGTDVTFLMPGLSSVTLDGAGAAGAGSGRVKVHVPAGSHSIELVANGGARTGVR
ncbi:MAG: hypothetical protein JXR37_30810 [Kiritimatiellae bacterium]|nr:hypothetical protein [Kiritimatiellia bacterium]